MIITNFDDDHTCEAFFNFKKLKICGNSHGRIIRIKNYIFSSKTGLVWNYSQEKVGH
jgi:hypothetical protein